MLTERPIADLAAHTAAFPGPHLEMVMDSILAGHTAGQLWQVAQANAGPLLLLWDRGNNVFYLGGRPASATARAELGGLLLGELRNRVLAVGRPFFKARALDPALDQDLAGLFERVEHSECRYLFYAPGQLPLLPEPELPGLRFTPIDQALLADNTLIGIDELREEIAAMWPTLERFATHGFGWAALLERQIICWCTSEYVGARACGCGIATSEAFRQRGLASATAARFSQEAAGRGLTHFWECNAANIPSRRVAKKLGFRLLAEERYLVGAFDA